MLFLTCVCMSDVFPSSQRSGGRAAASGHSGAPASIKLSRHATLRGGEYVLGIPNTHAVKLHF